MLTWGLLHLRKLFLSFSVKYFSNSIIYIRFASNKYDMQIINLRRIIDEKNLDESELAHVLFPQNKFPKKALDRVLAGESLLDAAQISILSTYSGLSISEMFSTDSWGAKYAAGEHTFTKDDFTAVLDTYSWTTKLYCKGTSFHEFIIHSGLITLSEYIKQLDILILKFKENE